MNDTTSVEREKAKEGFALGRGAFETTLWTVVLGAQEGSSPESSQALEVLCSTYWYPLYAFVRRRGCGPQEAEDLTQSFFEHLLHKNGLKGVGREKGKFRSFLLTALTNFLNNEYEKARTLKRGGQNVIQSFDAIVAEQRYGKEPFEEMSPERLFDRRWAFTVVSQVLAQLQQEYQARGKAALFQELHPLLTGELNPGVIATTAQRLGIKEGTLKVALHRIRRRFGEVLRSQIAQTVATPEEVEEEIRSLFSAISDFTV